MKPRLLSVIDINDEPPPQFGENEVNTFFEHRSMRTWQEVQSVLAGLDGQPYEADILLVDVSFGKDPRVKGATLMAGGDRIVPIGPTLALPFLHARDVVAFAPYSAHMSNAALREHAAFLISIGLIAAKTKGRVYASTILSDGADEWRSKGGLDTLNWVDLQAQVKKDGEKYKWLALRVSGDGATFDRGEASTRAKAREAARAALEREENSLATFLEELALVGNPALALEDALPAYRRALEVACESDRVGVTNAPVLRRFLESATAALENGSDTVTIDAALGVELTSARGADSISLRSLFADLCGWSIPSFGRAALPAVRDFVNRVTSLDAPGRQALTVLVQKHLAPGSKTDKRIDELIIRQYPNASEEELREILRIAVLFANVHGWLLNRGRRPTKRAVYEWLGFEAHSYHALFGRRTPGQRKGKVCVGTLDIDALDPLQPELNDVGACYLGKSSRVSRSDQRDIERYVQKFAAEYPDPHAAMPYDRER